MTSLSKLPNVLSGATWRCADLHLHASDVPTFTMPPEVEYGDKEANGTSLGITISDAEVALTLPRGPKPALEA